MLRNLTVNFTGFPRRLRKTTTTWIQTIQRQGVIFGILKPEIQLKASKIKHLFLKCTKCALQRVLMEKWLYQLNTTSRRRLPYSDAQKAPSPEVLFLPDDNLLNLWNLRIWYEVTLRGVRAISRLQEQALMGLSVSGCESVWISRPAIVQRAVP